VESEIIESEMVKWGQNRSSETLPPIEPKASNLRAARSLGILNPWTCHSSYGCTSYIDKFLPCLVYLLPGYLDLLTWAVEYFKVGNVLGGGLISGYPGMGIFMLFY